MKTETSIRYESAKALIAVVLFIAALLLTALTGEAKSQKMEQLKQTNSPDLKQGSTYIHPVLFAQ